MRRASIIFSLLMLGLLAGVSRGNGVYIPQQAYPTMPTIPVQRAIIVYRNGVETLVVESAFQTQSKDVAWILPLPAAPTKLEVGDAGMVTSASMAMRPRITHDLHDLWTYPLWALVFIGPFAWVRMSTVDPARRRSRYLGYLVAGFLVLLLFAILLPSLGTAGGVATLETSQVSVHSVQRLGDYECTVLSSPDAGTLSKCLAERSLKPLDASAQAIVADYIVRGWCFVVTQLHPATQELTVPRPLMATFATSSAVFPMKLTALANTKTHVELCVIADREATSTHFDSPAAADFLLSEKDRSEISPFYYSTGTDLRIGSPDVTAFMWAHCVVTKLVADLPPARMDADVAIGFKPLAVHREHSFSALARQQMALALLFSAAPIGLLIAAVIYKHGRKPSRPQRRFLFDAVGLIVVAAILVRLLLPTVPVRTGSRWSAYRQNSSLAIALNAYYDEASQQHVQPDLSAVNLPQKLIDGDFYRGDLDNPYTGGSIRRERSPGNFDIRAIDGSLQVCTYDENGVERHTPLMTHDGMQVRWPK